MKKTVKTIVLLFVLCMTLQGTSFAILPEKTTITAQEVSVERSAQKYKSLSVTYTHIPPAYYDYCFEGWGGRLNRYSYFYSDSTGYYTGLYSGWVTQGGCPSSILLLDR